MAAKVIRDRDNGYAAFFGGLRRLRATRVKIGIQGREADQIHPGGISMVDLGTIHEYGAPNANVPQRSFIRSTGDDNRAVYQRETERIVRDLVRDPKGFNAYGALFKLGERVRRDVILKIQSRIPPPLAQSTLEATPNRADIPLWNEGLLVASITSVVS